MSEIALVDRVICAAARAWENDGEVLATGIGLVPRLAASLCMRSINTDLIMTDSEAWVVNEPVPVGPRGDYKIKRENWMGFSRIFDNVWGGKRHAMVGPVQVDRFGQGNISMVGSDYARPKSMMLACAAFPATPSITPTPSSCPITAPRFCVGRGRCRGQCGLQQRAPGQGLDAGGDHGHPLHLHQSVCDGLWRSQSSDAPGVAASRRDWWHRSGSHRLSDSRSRGRGRDA